MLDPSKAAPEADLKGALAATQLLADEACDSRSFADAALNRLTGIVPSDLTTLSICDLQRGSRKVIGRSGEFLSDADRDAFNAHFHDHPLVRFHAANPRGPTQRVTDCMSNSHFSNSAVYADYYRRIGIKSVMALPLRIDSDVVISIVFNRSGHNFTDSERGSLDAVRSLLSALYRNIVAREQADIGLAHVTELATKGSWFVVRVAPNGVIVDAQPRARHLLQHFFPSGSINSLKLPDALLNHIHLQRHWGLDRISRGVGGSFQTTRRGLRLIVEYAPDSSGGYLLLRTESAQSLPDDFRHLPLTRRECEVVALIANGKTNDDVAQLLGLSVRTIQKHLENIFRKLGIETRTALVVRVMALTNNQLLERRGS